MAGLFVSSILRGLARRESQERKSHSYTQMPIALQVDLTRGFVLSVATGVLSYDEIARHLERKVQANVMGLPEVFDARDIKLGLSIQDLQRVAEEVRRIMGDHAPVRTAIVTNSSFIRGMAHAYVALSMGKTSIFEIFENPEDARTWVLGKDGQAAAPPSSLSASS